jgi:hypothetical protein
MSKRKRPMSINLDPRVRDRIEAKAFDESRSLSSVVEEVLREHFAIPKERPSMWKSNAEVMAA